MRSALAWKLSRRGRSTMILRKPKCVVGKMRLTTTSSSFPSFATFRVSPSLKSGWLSCPKRWISASWLIAGRSRPPFLRSPAVMCSLVIISMPPEPQQGS